MKFLRRDMAIALHEKKRTYSFPCNLAVVVENVTELIVRESGDHRLKTADGHLHIIPTGWLHLEIEGAEDWTV